jgi:hypothetical protein
LGYEKCNTFISSHLVQHILLSRIGLFCNGELIKKSGRKKGRGREREGGREERMKRK